MSSDSAPAAATRWTRLTIAPRAELSADQVYGRHRNLIQKIAGVAAAAARKWDASERHFETALQQAASLPHRIEQQEVRRWYARMFLERNASEDQEKAGQLLEEAVASYESLGMRRHRALVDSMSRLI